MKIILSLLAALISVSAFASPELVCDTQGAGGDSSRYGRADGRPINARIEALKKQGYEVEITALSTATSMQPHSNVDKVCVVLKYRKKS